MFLYIYIYIMKVSNICFLISFLLGILLVLITNPPPHYIIKLPNLSDTYIDDKNIKYKYKLDIVK